MATNFSPPSVNIASDATTRFVQLRTEIEDEFTDLHQMLDVRRQQLLDKLTELEEIHNKYIKHTDAINTVNTTIEAIKLAFANEMLADAKESALSILQKKVESIEKENVKSINIECLKVISDKAQLQRYLNSISISDSKISFQYSNRAAPILSKVNRGTNKGEIIYPRGICIDDGVYEVYICDYNPAHGSKIHVFSLEGEFIREFGKDNLKCPQSIALSSSDVFVTNSKDSHCLMKFNKDCTFVKNAGSEGSGDGQFNWPQGLCVANASVFVCDSGNERIQVFDYDLCFSYKFASEGQTNPQGIIHCSNQLFVSRQTGSTIFVYSLEGTNIKSIQLTGEGSPLNFAYYFTMDIAGNYLFNEFESNFIKIFSHSGGYVASLGKQHLQSPRGIAIGIDYLQNPKGLASNKQGLIVCVCLKDGAVFQTY